MFLFNDFSAEGSRSILNFLMVVSPDHRWSSIESTQQKVFAEIDSIWNRIGLSGMERDAKLHSVLDHLKSAAEGALRV